MEFSQQAGSSGPDSNLKVLRRRWAIVLNLAGLGVFAAAVYVTAVPQVYTATASVSVAAQPGGGIALLPFWAPGPQSAQSIRAARIAGQALHSSLSRLAVSEKVTISVLPSQGLVDITCTAPTAVGAAACANAFAAAYLKDGSDSAAAAIKQRITSLTSQISALQRAVARLTTKISSLPPNSAERAADQRQLRGFQSQLATLNGQLAPLPGQPAQTNGGAVIARAQPPDRPAGPDKTLVLPGGLAAGLLLGLIAAFWVDRRDLWIDDGGAAERYRE